MLAGLVLFPYEVKYFSKKLVIPYQGIGRSPESKDFNIVLYQLNANRCPHLIKVNNQATCKIYNKRPLNCRRFPFDHKIIDFGKIDLVADPDCKAIQKMIGNGKRVIEYQASSEEMASYRIFYRTKSINLKDNTWLFDKNYMKWRMIDAKSLLELFIHHH